MLISTKGRYALRVLIDMAEHGNVGYITLQDISLRQDISKKYLESIMPILVKNKLIESGHGKGGGYKLTRTPDKYTVLEILGLTEDTLAPVSCLKKDAEVCDRCNICRTLPMWKELYKLIEEYFKNKTIEDLMGKDDFDNYII